MRDLVRAPVCARVTHHMDKPHRDIMAPDTEPTDEELAIVMREALDVAMRRRAAAEERLRESIAEAVRDATARRARPATR